MKCQSDFDNEKQEILRQVDECVTNWWETDKAETSNQPPAQAVVAESSVTAEVEAKRRGLLREEESGELCLSCKEGDAKE